MRAGTPDVRQGQDSSQPAFTFTFFPDDMTRRPIETRIDTGRRGTPDDGSGGVAPEVFREALSRWASGVTVVAARDDDGRVFATTVSSFASVSARPPRIVVSLGPGAQVLPFVPEGATFVVNVLAAGQARLAHVYADAFPVGPSPFPSEGPPWIEGCHFALMCEAEQVVDVDGTRLVVGRVVDARVGDGEEPLVNHGRDLRPLGGRQDATPGSPPG